MSKVRSDENKSISLELPSLPQGWCWTTLATIAKIDGGITKDQNRKRIGSMREVPYLRVANVQRGYLDLAEIKTIVAGIDEIEALRLLKGDILFTEGGDRDKLGRGWVWNNEIEDCIHQNHIFRARPHLQLVDPKFVSLHGNFFGQKWFSQTGKQTTNLASINKGVLSRFPVPLPPLIEQRRIVAKIEELFSDLDAGVAALQRAKANLKRYRAAVLKAAVEGKLTEAWRAKHPKTEPASKLLERILTERRQKWEADQLAKFAAAGKQPPKNWQEKYVEPTPPETSGLPELPKGWCWVSLDSLCCLIADIDHNMPKAVEDGVKFLSAKDLLDDGSLNFTTDVKRISEQDYQRLSRKVKPQRNDIIYSRIGARLGKSRIVETDEKFLVSYSCCTIRSLIIEPRFLARYLDCGFVLRRAMSNTQSIGVPDLGLDKIKQFAVPLCSIDEQKVILTELEHTISVISAAQKETENSLRRATRLRQSILKQAFEGKLVPQDSSDEPAGVLLEQIVLEKSKMVNGRAAKRRKEMAK
jgi:type I restriction enzyme S subunit